MGPDHQAFDARALGDQDRTELPLDGECPTCGVLVPWTEMRGQTSEAWAAERSQRDADFLNHRRA